jgi:hypothetical protein
MTGTEDLTLYDSYVSFEGFVHPSDILFAPLALYDKDCLWRKELGPEPTISRVFRTSGNACPAVSNSHVSDFPTENLVSAFNRSRFRGESPSSARNVSSTIVACFRSGQASTSYAYRNALLPRGIPRNS